MKAIFSVLLIVWLAQGGIKKAEAENQSQPVSMIELLATPDHFKGKLVTVIGYLVIRSQGINGDSRLCLSREDEENVLGNCLAVVPSHDMLRRSKELSGMYVRMTGVIFSQDPGPLPGRLVAIKDVRNCTVWSDPEHPRGLYPFALRQ